MWQGNIHTHGFLPAASPKALKAISQTIRRWTLHHRSDKALQELAKMYNPYIQGWINYYGNFYRTQLRPTSKGSMSTSSAGRAGSLNGSDRCRHVQARHANPFVRHAVVDVEAIGRAKIVSTIDAGRKHDVVDRSVALQRSCRNKHGLRRAINNPVRVLGR